MQRTPWLLLLGCAACGGGGTTPGLDGAGGDDHDAPLADARPDAAPGTTFLDPTHLHDIAIAIAPADLSRFDGDQTMHVPCDVTIDGTLLANAGCRKKGGIGSVDALTGKPAFSIKLDEYVPGQKYLGLDKYVLNNAVQDPSLLHEHVAYEVFRRFGVWAHRTAYTQVSLNGEPRGIYVANEPVDKEFLRARFGETNDEGNLYESNTVDFALDPDGMELKDEDGRSRDDLNAAAAAVVQTPDASFAAAVGALIDLDQFATFFAADIALAAEDSLSFGRNNYYMYHRPDTDRFVFLPHGQDVIMGNPALDPEYPPAPRLSARVDGIPALRAPVDAAVAAAVVPGGALDPTVLAARIDAAVAIVTSTTRTDDFTAGDVATLTREAPVFAGQIAYRGAYIAGTAAFPACGDGVVQGGEQCDDGNEAGGDGCDGTCRPECTEPFTAGGGTWRLCPARRDWAVQQAACASFGGALAYPADAADSALLASIVRRRLGSEDFWIGLTDAAGEDTWRTPAGGAAPYVGFADNEPNGGAGENCVVSDSSYHRDRSCGGDYAALCRL
jgi:cysteine-rich repeat protein